MPCAAFAERPKARRGRLYGRPVEAEPDAAACAQVLGPLRHALLGGGFGPVAGPNRRALVPALAEKRRPRPCLALAA